MSPKGSRTPPHFRLPSSGHLEPIFTRKILNVGFGYACGFAPSDRLNLPQIWARILSSYYFASPYLIQCAQTTHTALLTLDNGLKAAAEKMGIHVLEVSQ